MAEEILHNPEENRFEIPLDDGTATLDYEEEGGDVLDFTSTVVPEELRGRGIGGELVGQALDWAREHGYRVIPTCPFVKRYVEEHPEYRGLLA